jgi:hypothetical protein
VPNLSGDGSLNRTEVEPATTVYGSFRVNNIGDPASLLQWKVETYPNWGTWAFTPGSGENLTPEEGNITVQVSVTAPNQGDMEFSGSIRVVNTDNSSDFEDISIYLKTPVNEITPQMKNFQSMIKQKTFQLQKIYDLLR